MKEVLTVRSGMLGGILFVVLGNLTSADMIKTMVLAAIGAVTSAIVSLTVKQFAKWFKRRKDL
jgi:hypothetical protein